MNSKQTIKLTNEFASQYDEHVTKGLWKAPEVLFNELKEFIKPNDKLLDIGIGTGLASIPFHNEGIEIYGVDGSDEMIKLCKKKNLAKHLYIQISHNQILNFLIYNLI
ncbi:MAG: class I SAM-dependent methyltransferase [Chloroflexia bacterium]|nr:class I SAM-dependent methyltransferase [Chloroflexia bacterium]